MPQKDFELVPAGPRSTSEMVVVIRGNYGAFGGLYAGAAVLGASALAVSGALIVAGSAWGAVLGPPLVVLAVMAPMALPRLLPRWSRTEVTLGATALDVLTQEGPVLRREVVPYRDVVAVHEVPGAIELARRNEAELRLGGDLDEVKRAWLARTMRRWVRDHTPAAQARSR